MVVVRVVVAKGHGGERKKEEKVAEKKKMGGKDGFLSTWTQSPLFSGHENQIYL
jgi:hypothetical protein